MQTTNMLHVAVAIIYNASRDSILISRRAANKHQGGLWELPGGKVEANETPQTALARELSEEVNLTLTEYQLLVKVTHAYDDLNVCLHVFNVFAFDGEPNALEGQILSWVACSDLKQYDFPKANQSIIARIALPDIYRVTADSEDPALLEEQVVDSIRHHCKLIQLRAPMMADEHYISLACKLSHLCRQAQAILMIKGDIELLNEPWCQGMHLTARQLRLLKADNWHHTQKKWLSASCHNEQELAVAASIGCDFATLSPVLPTNCHPDATPLGYDYASHLTEQAALPVFWLGGMQLADMDVVKRLKAQGVAGISMFVNKC